MIQNHCWQIPNPPVRKWKISRTIIVQFVNQFSYSDIKIPRSKLAHSYIITRPIEQLFFLSPKMSLPQRLNFESNFRGDNPAKNLTRFEISCHPSCNPHFEYLGNWKFGSKLPENLWRIQPLRPDKGRVPFPPRLSKLDLIIWGPSTIVITASDIYLSLQKYPTNRN